MGLMELLTVQQSERDHLVQVGSPGLSEQHDRPISQDASPVECPEEGEFRKRSRLAGQDYKPLAAGYQFTGALEEPVLLPVLREEAVRPLAPVGEDPRRDPERLA